MSKTNVHTIHDAPNPDAHPAPYPVSAEVKQHLKIFKKMNRVNREQGGSVVLVPLDKKNKRPAEGVLFSRSNGYPAHKMWSEKKLDAWHSDGRLELKDYEWGVLFSGAIGVLDFDCERDWDWFRKEFPDLDLSQYFVSSNKSKHSCGCPADTDETTYHIWFLRDSIWDDKKNSTPCLDDRHIDYLRDSHEHGTPHVLKIPTGTNARRWEHKPKDYFVIPLPKKVTDFFGKHWRLTKKEKLLQNRNYKFLELCETIPADNITSQNAEKIIKELKNSGHTLEVVSEQILRVRNDNSYGDRVGVGTQQFTLEQHNDWVKKIYDSHTELDYTTTTISVLARVSPKAMEITAKWLGRYGQEFDINYLTDLKFNTEGDELARLCKKYYNKWFMITTGDKKPHVWFKKFNKDGTLQEIQHFQDKTSFLDYCGIKLTFPGEKNAKNSAQWWFENHKGDTSKDKIVFKPFGILPQSSNPVPHSQYNIFAGYKMKYVKSYSNPTNDSLGDAIEFHIRNVLCWDGVTAGGKHCCNEELYDFYRAWLYKFIVLGERTKVGLVHFSKDKGTGKSMFSESLLRDVIGENYAIQCSTFTKTTKDTFSDYWEDCCLAVIEELPEFAGKNGEAWDYIKSLTTDDIMTSRKFMTAPDKANIFINLILNTNHWGSISSDWLDRRAQANRISNHYKGDHKYFSKLAKSFSYEGWENFIHRKLINDYHQFSTVKVIPHSNNMVDTPYRNEIMSRGNDSVIYFFQELFNHLSVGDSDYVKITDKVFTLNGLFTKFQEYKSSQNIDEAFYNTQQSFEKALVNKFEINIKDRTKKTKEKLEELNKLHTPTLTKTRLGRAIVMDEITIKNILRVIKTKTHQAVADIPEEQEVYDLDTIHFLGDEDDGGGVSYGGMDI